MTVSGNQVLRSNRKKVLKVVPNEKHIEAIERFLKREHASAWHCFGPLEIYLRVGPRFLCVSPTEVRKYRTLVIVSALINNAKMRGKGIFRQFYTWLESELACYGISAVYAENVLEPRLMGFYEKLGFVRYGSNTMAPCYQKIIAPDAVVLKNL